MLYIAICLPTAGMPLRMTPNFEDLSCEFAFGQAAAPVEDDPLMQEVRFGGNPLLFLLRGRCLARVVQPESDGRCRWHVDCAPTARVLTVRPFLR